MVSTVNFTHEQKSYVKNQISQLSETGNVNVSFDEDQFFTVFIDMDCQKPPELVSLLYGTLWLL